MDIALALQRLYLTIEPSQVEAAGDDPVRRQGGDVLAGEGDSPRLGAEQAKTSLKQLELQIVQQVREHGQCELVRHAVGRIPQHAQRFAGAERRRGIRRRRCGRA